MKKRLVCWAQEDERSVNVARTPSATGALSGLELGANRLLNQAGLRLTNWWIGDNQISKSHLGWEFDRLVRWFLATKAGLNLFDDPTGSRASGDEAEEHHASPDQPAYVRELDRFEPETRRDSS
jgi:hypothetical protein